MFKLHVHGVPPYLLIIITLFCESHEQKNRMDTNEHTFILHLIQALKAEIFVMCRVCWLTLANLSNFQY